MTLGEISQSLSALFFLNDSLQNRSVALAQRVAGHARELDVYCRGAREPLDLFLNLSCLLCGCWNPFDHAP